MDRTVLIVEYKSDVGIDQEYRFQRDPPFMIRINQEWPTGISVSLLYSKVGGYYGAAVAGITQPKAMQAAIHFVNGIERRIELVRDPENAHDRNAIKVIGHWTDASGSRRFGQLGWVPADEAAMIAKSWPNGPIGGRLEVIYLPQPDKSLGLRIDVGRPKLVTPRGAKKKVSKKTTKKK